MNPQVRRPHHIARRVILGICVAAHPLAAQPTAPRTDTIVKVASAPVHPGIGSLAEELSIGLVDGPEEYLLAGVTEMAVGNDGSMYIFDHGAPAFRVYNAAGRYVRTLGREGQGPGEYLRALGMAVLPDGRVLFMDGANWRINVYSPTGESLPQWRTELDRGPNSRSGGWGALIVESSGTILRRRYPAALPGQSPLSAVENPVWVRMRPDGTVIDTVRPPSVPRTNRRVTATRGRTMSHMVPFDPSGIAVPSPLGYFVTGVTSRYAFEIVAPGQPVVSIRRNVTPEPVSRADVARERERITTSMRRYVDSTWTWNGPESPATKPVYKFLRVASDGRIWVNVSEAPVPEPPPTPRPQPGAGRGNSVFILGADCTHPGAAVWDIFEPSGTYVGRLQVPAKVTMLLMRGDAVWAKTCGQDDVIMVKRYHIAWGR